MLCLYHSADLDGICSAAIVKSFYPDCILYGINHGEDVPWDLIKKHETVYLVDFCINNMDYLNHITNLIWIDHHISSIKKWSHLAIKGIQKTEHAACYYTWQYLYAEIGYMPQAVKLLSDYDTWKLQEDVLAFQYGMRSHNPQPDDVDFWKSLFKKSSFNLVEQITNEGRPVLEYIYSDNDKYIKDNSFITHFEGFRCIAVNRLNTNSLLFGNEKKKYPIMIAFGWTPIGMWRVSLYTIFDHIDVSEIAKKYGGGGHKSAAGFLCNNLPFNLSNIRGVE